MKNKNSDDAEIKKEISSNALVFSKNRRRSNSLTPMLSQGILSKRLIALTYAKEN